MDNPQASTDDYLQLIDWMLDPEQEPGPGAQVALNDMSQAGLLAGRYDIWLNATEQSGAVWPEQQLGGAGDLIAPIASPELMHQ